MMIIYDASTIIRCFHTQWSYFIVITMPVPTFQSANTVCEPFHYSIIHEVGTFVKQFMRMKSFFHFQEHRMDQ